MNYNLENVRESLYEYEKSVDKFLDNNLSNYHFTILDNLYYLILVYCRNL